jgi:uncharacterized protein YjbI with pentapeptide repeats
VNFKRADSPRVEFPGADFSRADSVRVEFPGADFARVEFPGADFARVEFPGADSARVNFHREGFKLAKSGRVNCMSEFYARYF